MIFDVSSPLNPPGSLGTHMSDLGEFCERFQMPSDVRTECEPSVSALGKTLLSVPVPVLSLSPSVLSCRSPCEFGEHAKVVDEHFL